MILSFINIRKVPQEMLKTSGFALMLKTSGFALGFQHLPRDLANVNDLKIMFDIPILAKFSEIGQCGSQKLSFLNQKQIVWT